MRHGVFVPIETQMDAEQEWRRRQRVRAEAARAADWQAWLARHFPKLTEFAERHRRLWAWFQDLVPGTSPRPRVEIWPRGGGKSSSGELGATFIGDRRTRRFCLYLSATQPQAELHVASISAAFGVLGMGRAVDRYGVSKGWRADMLRVDNGYNVLALGLDTASRGVKFEDARPDVIILDDVDARHDSLQAVKKKADTISQTILPAGAPDVAVLVLQNLVHEHSVVSQLDEGTADFLHGRQVFKDPAVVAEDGEAYKPGKQTWLEGTIEADGQRQYRAVRGRATWAGQSLELVSAQVNLWGRPAFMREAQHDMSEREGGLWNRGRDIDPFRAVAAPPLERITVAIDPNAEGADALMDGETLSQAAHNDAAGIMVGGCATVLHPAVAPRGDPRQVLHGYLLEDCTTDQGPGGPDGWAETGVAAFRRWRANKLVGEKNNGGKMVAITIGTVAGAPHVYLVHASQGKVPRAEPVQKLGEEGRIHHVGVFVALETELCTWRPGMPSPNRLDAYVWLFTDLLIAEVRRAPWFPGMRGRMR